MKSTFRPVGGCGCISRLKIVFFGLAFGEFGCIGPHFVMEIEKEH